MELYHWNVLPYFKCSAVGLCCVVAYESFVILSGIDGDFLSVVIR